MSLSELENVVVTRGPYRGSRVREVPLAELHRLADAWFTPESLREQLDLYLSHPLVAPQLARVLRQRGCN